MQIIDINEDSANYFFNCGHTELYDDLERSRPSREWYAEYRDKGYKAKVLVADDGEIAYTDLQIGKLLHEIDKIFDPSKTLIILVADPSEAFGAHGMLLRGNSAYR